jgi:hypothetical protein
VRARARGRQGNPHCDVRGAARAIPTATAELSVLTAPVCRAVQELGPYSLWQHHHAYTATCDERGDGTLCSDIVRRERCLRRLLRARAPGHVCAGTGFRCRHWAIWRISGCALAWQRLRSWVVTVGQVKAELTRIFAFRWHFSPAVFFCVSRAESSE